MLQSTIALVVLSTLLFATISQTDKSLSTDANLGFGGFRFIDSAAAAPP